MQSARGTLNDIETTSTFKSRNKIQRIKAMAPNCASAGLNVLSIVEVKARLQEALRFEATYVAKKVSNEQMSRDLQRCELPKADDPVTASDARRMLKCRFALPFEKTILSPLTTNEDPQFFPRLMKNPNLPRYLQALPAYYRQ
jgi:hypothetical protein